MRFEPALALSKTTNPTRIMEIKDIETKLRDIVAENLCIRKDLITPESRFVEDLAADSLDVVEIVIAVEDEFSINTDDDDVEKLTTFQQAVDFIKSKVG